MYVFVEPEGFNAIDGITDESNIPSSYPHFGQPIQPSQFSYIHREQNLNTVNREEVDGIPLTVGGKGFRSNCRWSMVSLPWDACHYSYRACQLSQTKPFGDDVTADVVSIERVFDVVKPFQADVVIIDGLFNV